MDKIILKELVFNCRLGVSASERQDPQRILVDLELFADLSDAAARDDLAASVDYEEVYSEIQKVVTGREYKLVETVTEKIARHLLQRFSLARVSVTVKKLAPLGPGGMKYAAVEIARSKDD
jgi:dihydroneopterin aldolase